MFCSDLLAFSTGVSRIPAAFKMAFSLCDKRQQLEAFTIVKKSSNLYVAGVLVLPLKDIDKLKLRQVSGFH